jgi:hypothetical protein
MQDESRIRFESIRRLGEAGKSESPTLAEPATMGHPQIQNQLPHLGHPRRPQIQNPRPENPRAPGLGRPTPTKFTRQKEPTTSSNQPVDASVDPFLREAHQFFVNHASTQTAMVMKTRVVHHRYIIAAIASQKRSQNAMAFQKIAPPRTFHLAS